MVTDYTTGPNDFSFLQRMKANATNNAAQLLKEGLPHGIAKLLEMLVKLVFLRH